MPLKRAALRNDVGCFLFVSPVCRPRVPSRAQVVKSLGAFFAMAKSSRRSFLEWWGGGRRKFGIQTKPTSVSELGCLSYLSESEAAARSMPKAIRHVNFAPLPTPSNCVVGEGGGVSGRNPRKHSEVNSEWSARWCPGSSLVFLVQWQSSKTKQAL